MARFYGWTVKVIDEMMLSEVVIFFQAIDILLTDENKRLLDFECFTQMRDSSKRRAINYYLGEQNVSADSQTMSIRYSHMVKKAGQKWPGEKKNAGNSS